MKGSKMDAIISVYKDGTWKLWKGKHYKLDAHYACDEPDWLVNIPATGIDEEDIVNIFRQMCEESINPDHYSYLVDYVIPGLILTRKSLRQ